MCYSIGQLCFAGLLSLWVSAAPGEVPSGLERLDPYFVLPTATIGANRLIPKRSPPMTSRGGRSKSQTIGPAPEVSSRQAELRQDPAHCGYNDLTIPNMAWYCVTRYANGEVSTSFQGCYEPGSPAPYCT